MLFDYLRRPLPCCPQCHGHQGLSSLPAREVTAGLGHLVRKLGWFLLCCCLWCPSLGGRGQGHWASPCIRLHAAQISGNFPHCQDTSSSQDLHLLFSPQSPLFSQPKQSLQGSTVHGQSPNCWVWFMSLYQLEDLGSATFVQSRYYPSLPATCPGCSQKGADFCMSAQKFSLGHPSSHTTQLSATCLHSQLFELFFSLPCVLSNSARGCRIMRVASPPPKSQEN